MNMALVSFREDIDVFNHLPRNFNILRNTSMEKHCLDRDDVVL